MIGPGAGAQVVTVLAFHTRDPIWASVLIPAAPLPFQLPACGPRKESRTAQSFGTLHPHGRPGRASWLWIGIALAIALTWGVNHRTEDLLLCLSSLYIRLSNKKKKKYIYIYLKKQKPLRVKSEVTQIEVSSGLPN